MSKMNEEAVVKVVDEVVEETAEVVTAEAAPIVAKTVSKAVPKVAVYSMIGLATTGAAAILTGVGYGVYKFVKHFAGKKKSADIQEDIAEELSDPVVEETPVQEEAPAPKATAKKSKKKLDYVED